MALNRHGDGFAAAWSDPLGRQRIDALAQAQNIVQAEVDRGSPADGAPSQD